MSRYLSVAGMFRGYEISENLQDFKTSCLFFNDCDADNIKANSFVANCKNLPNGLTAGYIEVIWSEATSVKVQRFTGYASGLSSYIRTGDGINWTQWKNLI